MVVTAVAPTAREAALLADGVLSSVEIRPELVRAAAEASASLTVLEPRLIGCFDQAVGVGTLNNGARSFQKRCFREDFTFVQTTQVFAASTTYDEPDGDRPRRPRTRSRGRAGSPRQSRSKERGGPRMTP